jgi:hypothetical protein
MATQSDLRLCQTIRPISAKLVNPFSWASSSRTFLAACPVLGCTSAVQLTLIHRSARSASHRLDESGPTNTSLLCWTSTSEAPRRSSGIHRTLRPLCLYCPPLRGAKDRLLQVPLAQPATVCSGSGRREETVCKAKLRLQPVFWQDISGSRAKARNSFKRIRWLHVSKSLFEPGRNSIVPRNDEIAFNRRPIEGPNGLRFSCNSTGFTYNCVLPLNRRLRGKETHLWSTI